MKAESIKKYREMSEITAGDTIPNIGKILFEWELCQELGITDHPMRNVFLDEMWAKTKGNNFTHMYMNAQKYAFSIQSIPSEGSSVQ